MKSFEKYATDDRSHIDHMRLITIAKRTYFIYNIIVPQKNVRDFNLYGYA